MSELEPQGMIGKDWSTFLQWLHAHRLPGTAGICLHSTDEGWTVYEKGLAEEPPAFYKGKTPEETLGKLLDAIVDRFLGPLGVGQEVVE